MIIRDKSKFIKGATLLVSFMAIFVSLFMPIIPMDGGKYENPLNFADDFFNKLSKGSSYFIPNVIERVNAGLSNTNIDLTIHMKNEDRANLAVKMLNELGATALLKDKDEKGFVVSITGSLHKIALAATTDSEDLFQNNGKAVSQRWNGVDHTTISRTWHEMLSGMIRPMQAQKLVAEAQVIDAVVRRAIEPAHNFFDIPSGRVADNIPMLVFLLVFYVVYTMWYGFAIFDLFEGVGLTMKKAAVKQEV
ncbi:hypothetical protein [Desulfovibrio litoralis]|uniref:Uncharacterized protein n=1 Tax=Desulfovibrio litoralis DSM 11393 TaxID=1121455 RepID=A0A1M7T1T4_9BACT|nr:hypothetical protein [Desulfovibrio litoralis]SHN64622.1 hypothetical protein SAMN02745728_01443 [Desulfovibrio litoralis DSM 11393]